MIEQLTEQGDAGYPGHIILGRLYSHRHDPLKGASDRHVGDLKKVGVVFT